MKTILDIKVEGRQYLVSELWFSYYLYIVENNESKFLGRYEDIKEVIKYINDCINQ